MPDVARVAVAGEQQTPLEDGLIGDDGQQLVESHARILPPVASCRHRPWAHLINNFMSSDLCQPTAGCLQRYLPHPHSVSLVLRQIVKGGLFTRYAKLSE